MSGKEPAPPSICVIVAAVDAAMTAVASVQRFADEVGSRGEVLVVDGSTDGTGSLIEARALPRVRVLRRPSGRLVPELWRDGLRAAGPLVALSTAQMLPSPGWLDGLRPSSTPAARSVSVVDRALAGLSPLDQAVYLLRYVHYHRRSAISGPGTSRG
ncbi:MAG: glycosyltransferase family 2 protein [Isosphaeraceae bacterium]